MLNVSKIVQVEATVWPARTVALWAQAQAEWYHERLQKPDWWQNRDWLVRLQERRAHHARNAREVMGML